MPPFSLLFMTTSANIGKHRQAISYQLVFQCLYYLYFSVLQEAGTDHYLQPPVFTPLFLLVSVFIASSVLGCFFFILLGVSGFFWVFLFFFVFVLCLVCLMLPMFLLVHSRLSLRFFTNIYFSLFKKKDLLSINVNYSNEYNFCRNFNNIKNEH